MTNQTQAQANATVNAVAKKPSGMDIAKQIFAEINDASFVLPEGKTKRGVFLERAITEGGLTKNGASTYYQNLCNAAKGKSLYSYTGKKATKAEGQVNEAVDSASAPSETSATETPAADAKPAKKGKKAAETAAA